MNDQSAGRLTGKVAIVTGGASGIGLATTRRFVGGGSPVVIGDLAVDRFAAIETELGDAVATVPCDVRIEDEVEALVATAVDRFGGLDIAFANAGTGAFGAIVDSDAADWMRTIEVNLLGPFLTAKHAAPRDARRRIDHLHGQPERGAAGRGNERVLQLESGARDARAGRGDGAGSRGIRVNAIGPGLVRTGLTEGMWLLPRLIAEFDDNAPLAATTSADDVASLVTFLASDESSSISGTLQLIDRGAHTMRYPDMFANFAAAGSLD